jgi:hypothetical protein
MVVDVFKEQLATIMEWHRRDLPSFKWGVVLHRRNERGRIRFGAVTSGGESLVLTSELLDELSRMSCWLDGAVRVRLPLFAGHRRVAIQRRAARASSAGGAHLVPGRAHLRFRLLAARAIVGLLRELTLN